MRLFSAWRALFAAESGFLLTATTKTTGLLEGIARGRTEKPETQFLTNSQSQPPAEKTENNAGPEKLLEKLNEEKALVDFKPVGDGCRRLNVG